MMDEGQWYVDGAVDSCRRYAVNREASALCKFKKGEFTSVTSFTCRDLHQRGWWQLGVKDLDVEPVCNISQV